MKLCNEINKRLDFLPVKCDENTSARNGYYPHSYLTELSAFKNWNMAGSAYGDPNHRAISTLPLMSWDFVENKF